MGEVLIPAIIGDLQERVAPATGPSEVGISNGVTRFCKSPLRF